MTDTKRIPRIEDADAIEKAHERVLRAVGRFIEMDTNEECKLAELLADMQDEAYRIGFARGASEAPTPELLGVLRALVSAFMSHTQWNGEPPAEIIAARAAILKAIGEQQ